MEPRTPGYEHNTLRGITIKNMIVTVACTATMVASVMGTWYNLKDEIHAVKTQQDAETRVNNLRIKILEDQVAVLERRVDDLGQTWRSRQKSND